MENFLHWSQRISKDLKFYSVADLKEDDVAHLFKVRGFLPVSQELIQRVRPLDERENVRQNVEFYCDNDKKNEQFHSSKFHEFTKLQLELDKAYTEMESEQEELQALVSEELSLMEKEKELLQQFHLLDSAVDKRERNILMLKQDASSLENVLKKSHGSVSTQEESLKQNLVNDEVDFIIKKLEDYRTYQCGENNSDTLREKMQEIWQLIEELSSKYPPKRLFCALSRSREQDIWNLSNPQISNDKQNDCSNGSDGASSSLENHLLRINADYQINHFSNCRERQEMELARNALRNFLENAHSHIDKMYPNDGSIRDDVKRLLDSKSKLAGSRAKLKRASELAPEINEKSRHLEKVKQEASKEHSTCIDIAANVKSASEDIEDLMYVITENSEVLKAEFDSAHSESDVDKGLYTFLSHPASKKILLQGIDAVSELSKYFNGSSCMPTGRLPYAMSKFWALEHNRRNELRLAMNARSENEEISILKEMKSSKTNDVQQQVRELCDKVKSHDEKMEGEFCGVLDAFEKDIEQGNKFNKRFSQRVREWWDQPGPDIKKYMDEVK